MTTKPKPRGRNTVDWAAARTFFLELEAQRSFGKVARKYGVTDVSVGRRAKKDGWLEDAAEFDRKLQTERDRRSLRTRAERRVRTLTIIDQFVDAFGKDVPGKVEKATAADLAQLVKLAELLEGEPTDRIEVSEVQQVVAIVFGIAGRFVAADQRPAFLEAMQEARSALTAGGAELGDRDAA